MLRKIRISLSALFFIGITLLFVDFTGALHHWLGWMAKVQFLPAVLAVNVVIIAALIILTLIFGRIYCSIICPLGVMQDIMARCRRKKNKYTYSQEKWWLRYPVLIVFVVMSVLGIGSLFQLLAPFSAFGRIATMLLQPLWKMGNNLLALIAEHVDSYAFYTTDTWVRSMPVLIIAAVTLVILFILAWRGGRTYCNTICPVGTLLSFFARFSLMKVCFNKDKCTHCTLCTRNCKSSCINHETQRVDYSRCVVCGNCVSKCKFGALTYGLKGRKGVEVSEESTPVTAASMSDSGHNASTTASSADAVDSSKRNFLLATALVSTAAMAQKKEKVMDGGLAEIEEKVAPQRQTPLTPPGSLSMKNLAARCTGCQLCVSTCPNQVLRPNNDFEYLMQPIMSYERGYCRPECVRCSSVCPTGAIQHIDKPEKASIQIGHAVWIKKNCVPITDGVDCGNCARHCPSGAIEMIPLDENDEESPMIPAVNEAACIGCGACEYVCPARPFSAIVVEGHEVHRHL